MEAETSLTLLLKKSYVKAKWVGIVFAVLLAMAVIISITLGKANISIAETVTVLFANVTGNELLSSEIPGAKSAIIWDIRLPRILCAAVIGCGLAVAGAVFQAVLMNPLADGYTLGVSGGAAFGASLAIFLNVAFAVILPVPVFAFIGAMLALAVVMLISRENGDSSSTDLIIAGIIVSCILSAGISFIKSLAGEQVSAIVNWLIGSLAGRSWDQVVYMLPPILICLLLTIWRAGELNILSLGDHEARHLGIDVARQRKFFLFLAALMTAMSVAVSGIIGFVGLIVPHALRFLVGSDNRKLVPLCALGGGLLLVIADTCSRALLNTEIPVGALTALFGGPFFFAIFRRRGRTIGG